MHYYEVMLGLHTEACHSHGIYVHEGIFNLIPIRLAGVTENFHHQLKQTGL